MAYMAKPNKTIGWVLFVTGWIMLVIGMALSFWLPSLIEDELVSALVFLAAFFGFAFASIILIGIGSRMADINWKVPDYGGGS